MEFGGKVREAEGVSKAVYALEAINEVRPASMHIYLVTYSVAQEALLGLGLGLAMIDCTRTR